MRAINSREEALKILVKIDFYGAYSNLALKDMGKDFSSLDRAFITRLVYGCVSRAMTLDDIISKFSKVKLKKLSKNVLEILRIAIYQMFFMEKVPDSAAVNESVKLCAKYAFKSRGFVNGVLRSIEREKENIKFNDKTIEDISIKYSFPKDICKIWCDEFGREFSLSLMDSLNSEPPLIIRANTLKTDVNKLLKKLESDVAEVTLIEDIKNAILVRGLSVGASKLFADGFYTVQDSSAMTACTVLSPNEGDTVIDLCAAPGGKTTYLAELMNNNGNILAFDIHAHKIDLIDENAHRLGISIINAATMDACIFKKTLVGRADKILADVPCSGLGIIRRKPEIKWRRENLDKLYKIQKQILSNAVKYLKVGGELVYSTCTINKKENEDIIEAVLVENSCMERVNITNLLPNRFRNESAKEGYVTLFPNTCDTDGFFICKMRKVIND